MQLLPDMKKISDVWPILPSEYHLHIYVTLGMGSPGPLQGVGEYFMRLFVPTQNIWRTRRLKVNGLVMSTAYKNMRIFSLK